MDEHTIRLECLKIAASLNNRSPSVEHEAERLADYVLGYDRKQPGEPVKESGGYYLPLGHYGRSHVLSVDELRAYQAELRVVAGKHNLYDEYEDLVAVLDAALSELVRHVPKSTG